MTHFIPHYERGENTCPVCGSPLIATNDICRWTCVNPACLTSYHYPFTDDAADMIDIDYPPFVEDEPEEDE